MVAWSVNWGFPLTARVTVNVPASTAGIVSVVPAGESTVSVAEGTATSTVVYSAAATDISGGTVTYALTGADAASFSINSSTGKITGQLTGQSRGTYSVIVSASDGKARASTTFSMSRPLRTMSAAESR